MTGLEIEAFHECLSKFRKLIEKDSNKEHHIDVFGKILADLICKHCLENYLDFSQCINMCEKNCSKLKNSVLEPIKIKIIKEMQVKECTIDNIGNRNEWTH